MLNTFHFAKKAAMPATINLHDRHSILRISKRSYFHGQTSLQAIPKSHFLLASLTSKRIIDPTSQGLKVVEVS